MKHVVVSLYRWILGLTIFAFAASAVLVAALILPTRHLNLFLRWSCRAVLRAVGVHVRVESEADLTDSPLLFVGNHVNILDPFVYGGYLPRPVRGVELESHFRWFLYGAVIRKIGNVPIRQRPDRSILRSYQKVAELVRQGISVVVLPEGHRTTTGRLGPFARAPFHFAKALNLDIVPVAIVGAYRIKRKGSWHIRPGTVVLRIGPPIRAQDAQQLDDSELRGMIREQIARLLDEKSASNLSGTRVQEETRV